MYGKSYSTQKFLLTQRTSVETADKSTMVTDDSDYSQQGRLSGCSSRSNSGDSGVILPFRCLNAVKAPANYNFCNVSVETSFFFFLEKC